jgi:hypothetical protein
LIIMTIAAASEQRVEQGDIIRTVKAIGQVIGLSERLAYHLVVSGELKSVRKIGGRYWASRSRLLEEVTGS